MSEVYITEEDMVETRIVILSYDMAEAYRKTHDKESAMLYIKRLFTSHDLAPQGEELSAMWHAIDAYQDYQAPH